MALFDRGDSGLIGDFTDTGTVATVVGTNPNRVSFVFLGYTSNTSGFTVSSVKLGAQTYTLVDSVVAADGRARKDLYKLVAPVSGAANVVVVMAGGVDGTSQVSIEVLHYYNADQTTPIAHSAKSSATGGAPTVSLTTDGAKTGLAGFCVGGGTIANSDSSTERTNQSAGGRNNTGDKTTSATSTSFSRNDVGDSSAAIAIELNDAGGGGSDATPTPTGVAQPYSVGTVTPQSSSNRTVSLTGVSAPYSVGIFTIQNDITLTGLPSVSQPYSVGAVTVNIGTSTSVTFNATGISQPYTVGSVIPKSNAIRVSPLGLAVPYSVGTVTPNISGGGGGSLRRLGGGGTRQGPQHRFVLP